MSQRRKCTDSKKAVQPILFSHSFVFSVREAPSTVCWESICLPLTPNSIDATHWHQNQPDGSPQTENILALAGQVYNTLDPLSQSSLIRMQTHILSMNWCCGDMSNASHKKFLQQWKRAREWAKHTLHLTSFVRQLPCCHHSCALPFCAPAC